MSRKVLFALLLVAGHTYATALGNLNKDLSATKSLAVNFKQTVTDAQGHVLQESSGEAVLVRPNLVFWHVKKPVEQRIVINQKKIWTYEPDLQQVTVRNVDSNYSQVPALVLSADASALKKKYTIDEMASKGDATFILNAKDSQNIIKCIALTFKDNVLQRLKLVGQLGQTTLINFNVTAKNKKYPATLFEFVAPKGVDVVNLDGVTHG